MAGVRPPDGSARAFEKGVTGGAKRDLDGVDGGRKGVRDVRAVGTRDMVQFKRQGRPTDARDLLPSPFGNHRRPRSPFLEMDLNSCHILHTQKVLRICAQVWALVVQYWLWMLETPTRELSVSPVTLTELQRCSLYKGRVPKCS